MNLTDFDYKLPKEFIAQYPLEERQQSRLMVVDRKTSKVYHRNFTDIENYLKAGDALILNDTKVVPARLFGRKKDTQGKVYHRNFTDIENYLKSGDALILNDTKVVSARLFGRKKDTQGKVEVFLLNCIKDNLFNALIRPVRVRQYQKVVFNNNGLEAEVLDKNTVKFNTSRIADIYRHGNIPLPPYIKRLPQAIDSRCYQTVYAKNEGAVAAPTAGLHFTQDILNRIKKKNVKIGYLTLHISWATFKSVRSLDITRHNMDAEYFQIPKETVDIINRTKESNRKVFAVGTTTTRVLETIANRKDLKDKSGGYEGQTDLFIYPGYKFKGVDYLITNFHLPRSTLLMLVCAFAGKDLIMQAYNEAIKNNYRFYSYGDCMLII